MTQKFSMDLGLAFIPETPNAAIFEELYKVYNAIKILASAVDQYTGAIRPDEDTWSLLPPQSTVFSQNTNRIYVPFSEDISPGELVNLYNDAGTLTAKLAGGTAWIGEDCRGFSSLGVTVLAGDYGEVTLFGLHTLISGATPGALYYVSNTTTGNITTTPPVSGEHSQPIGIALSATSLFFNPPLISEIVP